MKYLSFIRSSESYRETPPPPALMEAMGRFVERSLKDGTLVDTGGLLPSKEGVRVRLAQGRISVTDGPFSESKEVIGGWAILETATREQAIRIATEFMELHRQHWPGFEGESEVRPMFDPGVRLRLAGGELTVTDGPFSEAKEVIGGWAILKADTKEEALRVAREFMELHRRHWPEFEGEAEVRPMYEPGQGP